MPSVRLLPDELVSQIAAGEVVERPASIVKELVENALDAGATRIEVSIAGGGARGIAVSDDGCGLARRDAELAFRRHATSKIGSAAELARVETLGFRGEALPSIAAVAAVRMRTRQAGDARGIELVGEGGRVRVVGEVACATGTRVETADLFARVPARRKFLKTEATEAGHAVRWLEQIALARPDVRLTLERDGRAALAFLPTRDARERAVAVLPPSASGRLLEVEGQIPWASLRGLATPTDVSRGGTADIHVIVNGRPVRDRLLLFAVRLAYRDALPPGRHPAAVLWLRMDPERVDVNVHPAKSEVRFRDPGAIRELVRGSLTRALGRSDPRAQSAYAAPPSWTGHVGEPGPPPELALLPGAAPLAGGLADRPPAGRRVLRDHRYLGQVLGTYLVLEGPGSLVLLDQHAAHERVLFERMRRSLGDGKVESQGLLLPVSMELGVGAADALLAASAALERAGFEIELGERTLRAGVSVVLRAVPALLAEARGTTDWATLLDETAGLLREPEAGETRDGMDRALHHVLASAACHAAIRKGDRVDPREVDALLAALDAEVWLPNCPHGRPILLALDEAELERRFLRG